MNTMVGLEASLHTSVGETSCHNSMKDEKEMGGGSAAAGLSGSSAGIEDVLGSSMNDDFDPIALLNGPLYDNKFQESFANELSFGTFQDDSLPSCRDTTEDYSPRSNAHSYSLYNGVGDNNMKTPMASSNEFVTASSPETVDSFANDGSPEPPTEEQYLEPPLSQLSIPSGRMTNMSPAVLSDQGMNGFNNYATSQTLQPYMTSDSPPLQPQQQPSYLQQPHQQQQQYQPAPMSVPPPMPTSQQFNDMQALQMMQMQQQQQQQSLGMQSLQPTAFDGSLHQQPQFSASPSLQAMDPQQQVFQQQQMQTQAYTPASAPMGYNNQATLPGSFRISPGGRRYPPQSSASMSQLSQMRNVVMQQNQQQSLPFSQGLEQDSVYMNGGNNASLSRSLHGDSYGHVQQPRHMMARTTVNQSLSQSLHDPSTQRRGSHSFGMATPSMQPGSIVMPVVANPASSVPPNINEAMSQLCDSMRRSAMSRNFVKQLSNRSLTAGGQTSGRAALGRTSSMHSQNSSRSLMDNSEGPGRAVPVRRASSSAKYHLQHPMRGVHRHDSQQSLGRSNHSCKSFD